MTTRQRKTRTSILLAIALITSLIGAVLTMQPRASADAESRAKTKAKTASAKKGSKRPNIGALGSASPPKIPIMAEPSGKKLDNLYKLAWMRGLKTTYYLRSLGATHMEKGATSSSSRQEETVEQQPQVCSILDPDCEACQ